MISYKKKSKLPSGYKIKEDFVRNVNFSKTQLFLWTLISAFGIIFSEIDLTAGEVVGYNSHGRRDPFVPLVTQTARAVAGLAGVETAEEVKIEGVVYDPKRGSVVVINGSVMKEGEESGNVKVLQIKSDGAWFLISGTRVFKQMYQGDAQEERDA